MISTSMHSSAKNHAVKGKSELKKIAKHNDRGYLTSSYDKDKIQSVIGNSETIESDTIQFIDEQFEPNIKAHDAKQKRKDREIKMSASDYFDQKKNDIAIQTILQIGDKDFWKKWRIDETRTSIRTRKKYSVHKYDPNVIAAMNEIYKDMALEIENLYGNENTKQRILSKIFSAKDKATNFINSIDKEKRKRFDEILKLPKSEKLDVIGKLPQEEQDLITAYNEAKAELKLIKDKRLIERTQNGQMHFKIINLTCHYDEWSPHGHMVGVPWADGFMRGLDSKIAKSIYLNKYALEVAQERIHELVQEKMKDPQYQWLFEGEELKEKTKGRNKDYTPSQIAAIKESEKTIDKNKKKIKNQENEIKNGKKSLSGLQKRNEKAKTENNELKLVNDDINAQIAEKRAESQGLDELIREQKVKARNLVEQIKPLERIIRIVEACREFGLFDFIRFHLRKRLDQIWDRNEFEGADPEAIQGLYDLNDVIEEGFDIEEVENSIKTIQEMDEYDIH